MFEIKTSCQPIFPEKVGKQHETESVYMVKSCNKDAEKSLVQRCTRTAEGKSNQVLEDSVPVLGNDSFVYANKYCALCNKVTDYEFLNYLVSCVEVDFNMKRISSFEDIENLTDCIINIQRKPQNEIHLKKCIAMNETDIDTSTKCTKRDKQLCRLYQATNQDGKYKNPHCRKCIKGDMLNTLLQCPY